jgi:transcription antitermination factor NusG
MVCTGSQGVTAENAVVVEGFNPDEPRWYAVSTCSRQEKMVAQQMQARSLEHYLPLYTAIRDWNGRRAQVELPLFSGYIFVRLPFRERLRVLSAPGVAQIVSFGGVPAALPEEEILALRAAVEHHQAEPHPLLAAGRRVRIRHGSLAGMEGVVVRRKKQMRVVIEVEAIARAMAVEISAAELELLPRSGRTRRAAGAQA